MSASNPELRPESRPESKPESKLWYADGLRFTCTQCGNCCSGPPGAVWFDESEGRAMAAALGVSEATFLERYTRLMGVRRSLRETRSPKGLDCIFLRRESVNGVERALCAVYTARPVQCRTWPFWPEILESKEAWDDAKARTPCPGMGVGAHHTLVEITVARDRQVTQP